MADTNLGTYSPDDLIVVITTDDTVHYVSGFAEGTMISVEKPTPTSTYVPNADAGGGRIWRKQNHAMITMTLNQFTSSNDFLQELYDRDVADRGYYFTMAVIDGTGRSNFHSRQCFIESIPTFSAGTDVSTHDWVVSSVETDFHIGGNAKVPADIIAQIEALGGTVPARWR